MTKVTTVFRPDLETTFAPVFALKSAGHVLDADARLLTAVEQRDAWNALVETVPIILRQCHCFETNPEGSVGSEPLILWDFMNGREVRITVNKRGGYDLKILAEKADWSETQLSLDVLLLKLLALDYMPEHFRSFAG